MSGYLVGRVRCTYCNKTWVAVAHDVPDVEPLECPRCHTFNGYFVPTATKPQESIPRRPSGKQMSFIQEICCALDIDYPGDDITRQEAFLFIQEHAEEYRRWRINEEFRHTWNL